MWYGFLALVVTVVHTSVLLKDKLDLKINAINSGKNGKGKLLFFGKKRKK